MRLRAPENPGGGESSALRRPPPIATGLPAPVAWDLPEARGAGQRLSSKKPPDRPGLPEPRLAHRRTARSSGRANCSSKGPAAWVAGTPEPPTDREKSRRGGKFDRDG